MLFVIKPVLWNEVGYRRPGGWKATSGFPAESGFGQEEWNNSPRMKFSDDTGDYRVFHTESLKKLESDKAVGSTFVFMIASHDSVQQLVGVAGNAQYLGLEHYRKERERLVKALKLNELKKDAWEQPLVQRRYGGNEREFLSDWKKHVHWLPNWICPESCFWWPADPITLDATQITGSAHLPYMFSSYASLTAGQAQVIMASVPKNRRDAGWHRIAEAMDVASDTASVRAELGEAASSLTERLQLCQARIGQGKFREDLMRIWDRRCAVTAIETSQVLRASHIKPWAESNNKERLDPHNGLLLAAHLDALFDARLISFTDEGSIVVSDSLPHTDRDRLGLSSSLRQPLNERARRYMRNHRERLR